MDDKPRSGAAASAEAAAIPSREGKEPPTERRDSDTAALQADAPSGPQPSAAAASASSWRSQPSTAALGVHHQAPPMLRCLASCRDVQFVLMQMLTLEDLAALNSTCRSWRDWLLRPPLVDGLRFNRDATLQQLLTLAPCDWARRLVTSVLVRPEGSPGSWSLLPGQADDLLERLSCSCLLALLPRFTRLHDLSLPMVGAFAEAQSWPTCFTALSASLRVLSLQSFGQRQTNVALAHVGLLQQLQKLEILVRSPQDARQLNLSQLPLMPRLATFLIQTKKDKDEPLFFHCTPTQTQQLAQCRQLTKIHCGIWSPNEREVDDEGWQLPPAKQQIASGIATLVRGLTSPAGGSSAGSSSRTLAASAAESIVPCGLQILDLRGTIMSAVVWEHVSQLTSLAELGPSNWRSDLTPQQWTRLADFTQLRSIAIVAHPDDDYDSADSPLRTEHFLPPLLQCTQLTIVVLVGSTLSLTVEQLAAIARLPQLEGLVLNSVEIESVTPLAGARRLHTLILHFCRSSPGVVDFRRSLPSLPSLVALELEDRCRISAERAAPLSSALFARMPRLTAERFTQLNLLPSAPAPDTTALEQFAAEAVVLDHEEMDDEMNDEWEEEEDEAKWPPVFGPAWEH